MNVTDPLTWDSGGGDSFRTAIRVTSGRRPQLVSVERT